MSILLQSVEIRHERRIRVLFTSALDVGAYGVPAPAFYTLVNIDGRGPDPGVQAALLVPNSSSVVELALNGPLVKGARYALSAIGVPALDTSVTPGDSTLNLRWGVTSPRTNTEPAENDRQQLLYGIDLLWAGDDYEETATGDLARIDGTPNVAKALNRGVESRGLAWDPTYGAGAREFVDSPSAASGTLKGSIAAQLLRDPRVKGVKITYQIDVSKTFLFADATLISGEPIERVSVEVPNDV